MSWIHVRLRDVCEIVSGATPKTSQSEFWDGGIPWVTPKDLSANPEKFIGKGSRSITEEGLASCSARLLPVGSVLFSSRAPIGLTGITSAPLCTNQGFKSLVPDKSKLDSEYLYHWLNSNTKKFRGKGRGATFAELSKEMVSDFEIPLPPLAEQQRIAKILDKALETKETCEKSISELDKLQQSVFLDMFGDPVTNAKRWIDTEELCDHAMISSGITTGRRMREAEVTPVPYLAVSNVQDQRIVLENVKTIEATSEEIARYALEKGDILLTEGGDPDKLGRGAIWEGQIDPCIHQNHVFKVRLNSTVLRREFLSALLSSARGKRYFLRGAKQTTGIASINMSQLKKFPLLIPPLELQDRYVAFLDQLSSQRQIFQMQSAEMEILFKSLQQRAFSGDL